ncbi:hypothetical protein WME88_35625 [Sorangium sp. So ce216]
MSDSTGEAIMRDVMKLFPKIVEIFEAARFSDTHTKVLRWAAEDPRILIVPRKGHSRGFWNTIAMASLTTDSTVLASLWRLSIIESGLEQAARANKHKKFRAPLAQDEEGFNQVLAELFCIGALGPHFLDRLELEQPGSKKGKNYDIHLEGGGHVVQADVKWRTETPVGDGPPDLLEDLAKLLAADVTCTVYLTLRSNVPSEADRIRAACMIADCVHVERNNLIGPPIARADITGLPKSLQTEALHLDLDGVPFHKVEVGGVDALYVPSERVFKIADRFVDHIELSDNEATVVVIPKSETRPVFAQKASGPLKFDYSNPESWGIENLLSSVYQQLPAAGINVPCLGLEDRFSFDDAEFALLGEPDLFGNRTGGLFANESSNSLSAVLAFSLTPFGVDGTPADTEVKLFPNANAATPLPDDLGAKLKAAIEQHAEEMVKRAHSLK